MGAFRAEAPEFLVTDQRYGARSPCYAITGRGVRDNREALLQNSELALRNREPVFDDLFSDNVKELEQRRAPRPVSCCDDFPGKLNRLGRAPEFDRSLSGCGPFNGRPKAAIYGLSRPHAKSSAFDGLLIS
jgi:hypothetical protein